MGQVLASRSSVEDVNEEDLHCRSPNIVIYSAFFLCSLGLSGRFLLVVDDIRCIRVYV